MGRNPGCPNTSISRHQARPASCPSETIACRASQPALRASLQARTARPTGSGQASQRQDERRSVAPGAGCGGEARQWKGWGHAAGLKSRLSKPSISRHQARPASCPTQMIACRESQPALTASPQARTARPTGGGRASRRQDEKGESSVSFLLRD